MMARSLAFVAVGMLTAFTSHAFSNGLGMSAIDSLESRAALKHQRDALKNEDAFMAAHLVSEGYKVIPP